MISSREEAITVITTRGESYNGSLVKISGRLQAKLEAGKVYTAAEAMELVKKTATKKFDETIAQATVRVWALIRNMLISRSAARKSVAGKR